MSSNPTSENASKPAFNKKALFCRAEANTARKLELTLPTGELCGEHLLVVNQDADVFAKGRKVYREKMVAQMGARKELSFAEIEILENELLAAAVVGWSLDEAFTPEAVVELLTEAPHIREDLNSMVYNRQRFFKTV